MRGPAKTWWPVVAAVAGFAVVTVALSWQPARDLDLAVRDLADAHRPAVAGSIAQTVNRLGSGGLLASLAFLVAVGISAKQAIAKRANGHGKRPTGQGSALWPIASVVAAFLVTGIVIQPLKEMLDRAAPHSPLPDQVEASLFGSVDGLSYPSGHAVNAIVWYGVLCLLLAPLLSDTARRWVRWTPPVLVCLAATFLGYHWLTDMVAGLCLGIAIDRTLVHIPWPAASPGPPTSPAASSI